MENMPNLTNSVTSSMMKATLALVSSYAVSNCDKVKSNSSHNLHN